MKPVVIIVGGGELTQWTEMQLKRSKEKMTGELEVAIFAGGLPPMPMLREIVAGSEIQVYVAGQLAFTGTVDSRQGTGTKKKGHKHGAHVTEGTKDSGQDAQGDTKMSLTLGPNEYTIKLSARGKTKRLMDSSHQHPTTNMMQPTTKEVVEKLVEPWKIETEWKGEVIKLDKVRFRDGNRVIDELNRVATENCYFMYETRDGKMRVTDGVGSEGGEGQGDPLILGQNIITFSAEQSEHNAKSKVKVKGQRSDKHKWGQAALHKTFKETRNHAVKGHSPLTVHHAGDADDKTLERRARFESNKHHSDSKKITVEVFHIQSPSGQPWDIGDTHYVEIPPEGIFDVFECTELTYHVDHEKTLKTTLTLSPPPSGGAEGSSGGFGLSSLNMSMGDARRSQAGISSVADQYPASWGPAQLSELPFMTLAEAAAQPPPEDDEPPPKAPPLQLPPWFRDNS